MVPAVNLDKMNGLERDYADRLAIRWRAGEILWWGFQAVTLRLGDDTRYTPDFTVLVPSEAGLCQIEQHETKGHMRDDARVKVRAAAAMYPWMRFYVVKAAGRGRGFARPLTTTLVPSGELQPVPLLRGVAIPVPPELAGRAHAR